MSDAAGQASPPRRVAAQKHLALRGIPSLGHCGVASRLCAAEGTEPSSRLALTSNPGLQIGNFIVSQPLTLKAANRDTAEKLTQAFLSGKVAIFPTDTVYGLGCILEEKAIRKIFTIKNRRPDKPLPLLIADLDEALSLAHFSPTAREAATKFWPGATTLVLNARKKLPPWVCREGKVALRIPNHLFLREVIRQVGQAIVGTSANLSGEEPVGCVSKISKKILAEVDLVIDGGKIPGKASVVYDFTGPEPIIIRT